MAYIRCVKYINIADRLKVEMTGKSWQTIDKQLGKYIKMLLDGEPIELTGWTTDR